jgi:hypothetical protein
MTLKIYPVDNHSEYADNQKSPETSGLIVEFSVAYQAVTAARRIRFTRFCNPLVFVISS